jgi:parallel beta-helix repeat protein
MKKLQLLVLLGMSSFSFATNWYVNPNAANNNGPGTTAATAYKLLSTVHFVAKPGDTVFVMPGTFTSLSANSDVFDITNSGNTLTGGGYITYKAYDMANKPIFQMNAGSYQGILVYGAKYIILDGLIVIGNNDNVTLAYAQANQNASTRGIGIGIGNNGTIKSDHIIVKNCTVSKCGSAGIGANNADYITFENNTVFECAWYASYDTSGINLYQMNNSDTTTGIKNFVTGNICYNNKNLVGDPQFTPALITDGNGIIIDDFRNTQNGSTQGIYTGKTYLANNVCFNNGGRGIHTYLSDNVIIVNNTCYKNCQTPEIKNTTYDGEFSASKSDNVIFENNIAYPDNDVPPVNSYNITTTQTVNATNTFNNNLWFVTNVAANPVNPGANSGGSNVVNADPLFVLSGITATADFRIQSTSPAINKGITTNAPALDKDGNSRVGIIDLGAYENQNPLSIFSSDYRNNYAVFPNPANDFINLNFNNKFDGVINVNVINDIGKIIITKNTMASDGKISLALHDLPRGVYYISIKQDAQQLESSTFIKR